MGRYYRMSKKVTEDQVKEILRETLELEDVEEAEYEAKEQNYHLQNFSLKDRK